MSTVETSILAQNLDARRVALHRNAVRSVAKHIRGVLVGVGVWYWPIIVLAAVVVALILHRLDALDGSTVQYVVGSARWFAFSLGVIVPLGMMRPHLAAGGTRRALIHGLVRGAAWAGATFGIVIACLYTAEQSIWRLLRLDWYRSLGLAESTGAVGFVVNTAGEGLVAFTYFLLGAAVSGGFARFGPWLGLVVCLGLGIPAVVADIALYAGPATALAELLLGMGGPLPALGGLLVVGAAAAVTYVVLYLLLRDIPVKRPST
jgi:hypothetical protein